MQLDMNADDATRSTSYAASSTGSRKRPRNSTGTAFACGLGAGIAQAGLLNPYDRALYLSVKEKRPFLHPDNFQKPYQGFIQPVAGRAVSGGLFFPLETMFRSLSKGSASSTQYDKVNSSPTDRSSNFTNFLVGSAAGSVNALFLNPLSAIKYRTWGRDKERSMISEARHMWQRAGFIPFFHGFLPTVIRDVVFGGTYTFIRYHWKDSQWTGEAQWASNMGAAAIATVASGPFNLARNVQFATASTGDRPSIACVLSSLWRKTRKKKNLVNRVAYLQNRLRIGWGTARVAAGMALGQYCYDTLFSMAAAAEKAV